MSSRCNLYLLSAQQLYFKFRKLEHKPKINYFINSPFWYCKCFYIFTDRLHAMIQTAEWNNEINSSEILKLFLSWWIPMVSLNSLPFHFSVDVSRLTPDGIQNFELEITMNLLGVEQSCNLGWEAPFRMKPLRMEHHSPTLTQSPILSQTRSTGDWEQDRVFLGWHDILVQMKWDWGKEEQHE